jgi:ribonuclease P protein component
MPSHPFTKTQRVRRRGEFQHIFDIGYRISTRYFTLLLAPGTTSTPRLGIVASKKLGDAVRRNRAKRLIREVFRHIDRSPGAAVDVVVIPRREVFNAIYTDLEREFRAAWRRGASRIRQADAR